MNKILDNHFVKICIGGLFCALFAFIYWQGINHMASPYFDETHYVTAARAYSQGNFTINREHPPLGKTLIAIGMSWKGDRPEGWRIISYLFGVGTLIGVFTWSLLLFRSLETSLFVLIITATNQLLYVQSRIAMLDGILVGLLVGAIVSLTYWYRHQNQDWSLILGAAFLGLAMATKWFALFPILGLGLFVFWRSLPKKKTVIKNCLIYTGVMFATYFMTFPAGTFWQWQWDIWTGQLSVPGSHPYASSWWTWPLQLRPMWYAYEPIPASDKVRGIFFVGNPVALWLGFFAILWTIRSALLKKSFENTMISLGFLTCWLCWALIPRELNFFFYYFPASIFLGLALASTFQKTRWILWTIAIMSICFFIYFIPVLDASPRAPSEIQKRQWFQSWI